MMKLTVTLLLVLFLSITTVHAGGDPARGNELSGDCSDCHGEDGLGDEQSPQLAGREEAYLIEQLKAFKSGERLNGADMMLLFVEDLNEQDMADLAAYYASKDGG